MSTEHISHWCATPSFMCEIADADGPWRPVEIAGHVFCKGKRWHDLGHSQCCFSDEETESWGCECSCHADEKRATVEEIAKLRADPEFQVRLAKSIERNRRALERLAE